MKVTAEDLQRQYREMGDDELRSLHPNDLMDLARSCLEQEIARRGLTHGGGTPSEAPHEEPGEESVAVATFVSAATVEMAQSALKAAGIPTSIDGMTLLVPVSYEHHAHEVLESLGSLSAELVEEWLRGALPGRRVVIEDMLAEEDLVAARLTIDGAHQAFCFARIADGAVAETWHNFAQLPRR